ncbi:MAG: nucleotidyltransferase domain-containing protein [Planctomycetota bacterium]|nr:nucleotidyltransferase domain-containing protein [Planctomycetota bacterium]
MTAELKEQIAKAAEALKKAGAREVYLFGSIAQERIRQGSDIDMAVSGLPPARFFQALGEAADLLDVPLDLVDLDEDNPFTEYLREHGELVRVG